MKTFLLDFYLLFWKCLIVKAKKILKNFLYAKFDNISLSICFQSTIERRVLKSTIDLSFISGFVSYTGSLLESSIKSLKTMNIGKWSDTSAVIIPECISLFGK